MLPLLQLAPRFSEGLKSALTSQSLELAPTFFSNPEEGPEIVDISRLAITVIIKGREITGTIVDGGSRVNVISQRTCSENGNHAHSGTNGGYQFSSANQTHSELGDYNQRARVPDTRSVPATQRTRVLPPVVRKTLATDGTY